MADAAKDAAVAEAGSSRRQPVGVLTDPASLLHPLETQPTSRTPCCLHVLFMFVEVDIVVEEADKEAEHERGEGPR